MDTATAKTIPTDSEPTTTIRISRDLAKMIGLVAGHKGLSIPDYLDEHVRPSVKKQYERALRDKLADIGGEGG